MFKKYTSVLLLCLFALLTQVLAAQTYCLRYNLAKSNNSTAEFTVSLKATGTTFGLGASNLQFKYNLKALSNPTLVSNALTKAAAYNDISLTQPQALNLDNGSDGLLSINFDFAGNSGTGLPIGLIGTDIAVLRFQIIDSSLTPNFRFYENGTAGTVVFNDNTVNPVLLASTGNCEIYNSRIPILNIKAAATPIGAFISIYDRPSVTINWTTSFEKTGSYFIVERSFSGQPFVPIGSYLFATYTFVDLNPLKGTNKYRVKQVDASGIESTSREVEVTLEKDAAISVYPSVITELNGFLTLDVPRSSALDRQDYRIFNSYGREFLKGKTAERLDINVGQLPNGTYFLKVGDDQTKFFRQ
jgi:hypothetical protein